MHPLEDTAIGFCFSEARGWDAYFGLSMIRIARELPALGKWIAYPSGPMIDKARNQIVRDFLASDKEYLLFVDTDMTFSPGMVQRLWENRSHDTILSGLCKDHGGLPVAKVRKDDGWYAIIETESIVSVDMTGCAFVIASRETYEKVLANARDEEFAWYEFHGEPGVRGEDATFCVRAKAIGHQVHVDGSIRPGHRKLQTIGAPAVPE
jgi:hypothetical protein